MSEYQKILFVSLCSSNDAEGLKQALSLARNNDAKLHVLSILPSLDGPYSDHKEHITSSISKYMDNVVEKTLTELDIQQGSITLCSETLVSKNPAETAIQFVIRDEFDLLIKGSETGTEQAGFKAIDMAILRKCPVPVWLCRPISSHRQDIRVAVAIDALGTAPEAEDLAIKLLKTGKQQSQACDGTLRVLSCLNTILHSELRNNVFLKLPENKIDAEIQKERGDHLNKLSTLIEKSAVSGDIQVQRLDGLADDAIPKYVEDNHIDVLVMGTLARTGIAGIFIGNTAENIIQQLNCSLLTVKPSGFVSPVKLY